MAKRSAEAQQRIDLKRAAARRDREGAANLVAAAVTAGTRSVFVDFDLALGAMDEIKAWSPARRKKVAEAGRTLRLSFQPETPDGGGGVDLVVRIPADRPDLAALSERLVGLGLASNRRRPSTGFVEFTGSADEAAVRVLVEAEGGCVTAIASPAGTTKPTVDDGDAEPATGKPSSENEEAPVSDAPTEAEIKSKIDTPVSAGSAPNASSGTFDHEETAKKNLFPIPDLTSLLSTPPTSGWPDRRGEGRSGSFPGLRPPPSVRPAENGAAGPSSDLRRTPSDLSAPSTNAAKPSTNGKTSP